MIITIDGPMASGKSSTAQKLAEELKFFYINSGFLFRGLAYAILKISHHFGSQQLDISAVDFMGLLSRLKYSYEVPAGARLFFDGTDVTHALKESGVATVASMLGTDKEVRNVMALWQQDLAQNKDAVVEGRDAGSVVFTSADAKIFLTADPNIRAKRWQQEQATRGVTITIEKALEEVVTRDQRDSTREIAPLIIPEDATVIDNSTLTLAQTVGKIHEVLHSFES